MLKGKFAEKLQLLVNEMIVVREYKARYLLQPLQVVTIEFIETHPPQNKTKVKNKFTPGLDPSD